MKKRMLLTGVLACMLMALPAGTLLGCASTDNSSVSSVGGTSSVETPAESTPATSDASTSSQAPVTSETPTTSETPATSEETSEESTSADSSHEHEYTLVVEKAGTCNAKGEVAHYVCEGCDAKFDLLQNEISNVEGEYDYTNHAGTALLTATAQPTKLVYLAGEAFDPTGMTVAYKCEHCDGEVVDNQFLTYTYSVQGATAFGANDTKITVNYNGLSFDIAVTVSKAQAEISGLLEEYVTTCLVAPKIEVTSNVLDAELVIKYFAGETEVTAEDFVAGQTYTVKVSVAETDLYYGAEETSVVTVSHGYAWQTEEEDWQKLHYQCACGDKKDFYALDYQSPYVDEENLKVDLSKYVVGAQEVSVKSVQQIVRMQGGVYVSALDGEVVDIEYENEGFVYTFKADLYEQPSGEWKPYILTLAVVYVIDGVECPVVVEVRLVDKVITTAEDLLDVMYTGAVSVDEHGVANTGYYVLANDIDAKDLTVNESTHAWQAAIGFRGTFEGNDHVISNLNVTGGQGLFGAIGDGAKISNVTFTNVTVANGTYAFAYCARTASFTNVVVEFSVHSQSYLVARTQNSTFSNVSVLTDEFAGNSFVVDGDESAAMPEGIAAEYFAKATISFDTDGGEKMPSVEVVIGRTMKMPATPVKTSEDYDYEFLYWTARGEKWDFNTPISKGMTLVAVWEEKEKVKETELIAEAVSLIALLPEMVTMPDNIYYVPSIMRAKAAVDVLSEEGKAQIPNMEKLSKLLRAVKGYETVYIPDATGVKAIPAAVHNPAANVGVTGALSTDDAQGVTFKATAGEGGKAAIQFVNFPSVEKYTTLYFYVKTSAGNQLYMADSEENYGWGTNGNNSGAITQYQIKANEWSLVSIDTLTRIISSNWVMSIWGGDVVNATLEIGAIVGYDASATKEVLQEVDLAFGNKVDTGATKEYGKVYNISREQWYIDNKNTNTIGTLQQNKLANALPDGYDYFTFWIYNGTGTEYNFHLAGDVSGDWTDSKDSTVLTVGEWTKITISAEDIALNKKGQWYVYILGGDGQGAAKDGWKISTIYAGKME